MPSYTIFILRLQRLTCQDNKLDFGRIMTYLILPYLYFTQSLLCGMKTFAMINWKVDTILYVQTTFCSTIVVTFLELIFEPPFQKKLLFLYIFCLLPRVDPVLREWISYGGKRTSANPAEVAVHPF